jgi:hypothetical protein
VTAKEVGTKDLSVQFALIVTNEALGVVGDVQTTVSSALQGSKDLGTSGGPGKTNIKEGLERTTAFTVGFNVVLLALQRLSTLVHVSEAQVLEVATSQQQAGAIGGGVVGETSLDTIARKLVGIGGGNNNVTRELGVDQLGNDVLVGDANAEAVLGGRVLVLVLGDQTLASIVVSLAL